MTIVEINLEKNTWFELCFCITVFVTLAHAASNLKSLNDEINYRKKNGPTKYSREKYSDPWNTQEKKFRIHEHPRKNFGTIEYQREKSPDSRNTHEKTFWTHEIPKKAQWHDGTKPTRPTTARDPQNLAHSFINNNFIL